jgi:hypothetical protein
MKKNNRKLYGHQTTNRAKHNLKIIWYSCESTERNCYMANLTVFSKRSFMTLIKNPTLRSSKWKQTKIIFIWWYSISQEYPFFHSQSTQIHNHILSLAKIQTVSQTIFLEGKHVLDRWLFCMFSRRMKSWDHTQLHTKSRLTPCTHSSQRLKTIEISAKGD